MLKKKKKALIYYLSDSFHYHLRPAQKKSDLSWCSVKFSVLVVGMIDGQARQGNW